MHPDRASPGQSPADHGADQRLLCLRGERPTLAQGCARDLSVETPLLAAESGGLRPPSLRDTSPDGLGGVPALERVTITRSGWLQRPRDVDPVDDRATHPPVVGADLARPTRAEV